MKGWLRLFWFPMVFAGIALAQSPQKTPAPSSQAGIPPHKQSFYYHYEWTGGAVITPQEWRRGASIDARRNHLPPAPAGDEWREIDRNYVLAATSTHAIVRVIAAPHPTVPDSSGGQP